MSRRPRLALVTAGSALAGAAVVVPADAAPLRWWTVRATRSATVTVRLAAPTVLLLGEPGDRGGVVQISGGGSAAGFLLTPVRGGDSVGQLELGGERYSLGDERQPVPAGTYTLRVVAASAPVVVRVPVIGASATWRAERPVRTQHVHARWDVPAGPVLLGGADVRLTPSSIVLLSLRFTGSGMSEDMTVCLSDRTGICGPFDGVWAAEVRSAATAPSVQEDSGFAVYADRVATGAFTARWRVVSTGAAVSPAAFALVIG